MCWSRMTDRMTQFARRLLVGLLISCSLTGVVLAQSQITPAQIEATLRPGECSTTQLTITTEQASLPELDAAILIDTTSSMRDVIEEARRDANQIVTAVQAFAPEARFAIAAVGDYAAPDPLAAPAGKYGTVGDEPWKVNQDLTPDANRVQGGIRDLPSQNGGDDAEAYLRALYETQFLDWHDGSQRLVVLIGDAAPHEPDPGRDGVENTADDLSQAGVLAQLKSAGIAVLAIYTSDGARAFFEQAARETGGEAFRLASSAEVPHVIEQLIEAAASRIKALTLDAPAAQADWVSWSPAQFAGVGGGESRQFDVKLCALDQAASGDYAFKMAVLGDGTPLAEVPVTIHVPSIFPWWILLLLLIPVLLLLWWLLRRRRPQPVPVVAKPLSRPRAGASGLPERDASRRRRGSDITHGRDESSDE
jgi:hypothetical protein